MGYEHGGSCLPSGGSGGGGVKHVPLFGDWEAEHGICPGSAEGGQSYTRVFQQLRDRRLEQTAGDRESGAWELLIAGHPRSTAFMLENNSPDTRGRETMPLKFPSPRRNGLKEISREPDEEHPTRLDAGLALEKPAASLLKHHCFKQSSSNGLPQKQLVTACQSPFPPLPLPPTYSQERQGMSKGSRISRSDSMEDMQAPGCSNKDSSTKEEAPPGGCSVQNASATGSLRASAASRVHAIGTVPGKAPASQRPHGAASTPREGGAGLLIHARPDPHRSDASAPCRARRPVLAPKFGQWDQSSVLTKGYSKVFEQLQNAHSQQPLLMGNKEEWVGGTGGTAGTNGVSGTGASDVTGAKGTVAASTPGALVGGGIAAHDVPVGTPGDTMPAGYVSEDKEQGSHRPRPGQSAFPLRELGSELFDVAGCRRRGWSFAAQLDGDTAPRSADEPSPDVFPKDEPGPSTWRHSAAVMQSNFTNSSTLKWCTKSCQAVEISFELFAQIPATTWKLWLKARKLVRQAFISKHCLVSPIP